LYGKDRYVPTDAESRRVARAHDLVKRGWRGRAARTLRSDEEVKVLDEKSKQDFLAVFPQPRRSISELTPPQQDDNIFIMSVDDFVITLKKTFNGSAGGPTGSMGEHFRDIYCTTQQ
jgi:hypothetical protein